MGQDYDVVVPLVSGLIVIVGCLFVIPVLLNGQGLASQTGPFMVRGHRCGLRKVVHGIEYRSEGH